MCDDGPPLHLDPTVEIAGRVPLDQVDSRMAGMEKTGQDHLTETSSDSAMDITGRRTAASKCGEIDIQDAGILQLPRV